MADRRVNPVSIPAVSSVYDQIAKSATLPLRDVVKQFSATTAAQEMMRELGAMGTLPRIEDLTKEFFASHAAENLINNLSALTMTLSFEDMTKGLLMIKGQVYARELCLCRSMR